LNADGDRIFAICLHAGEAAIGGESNPTGGARLPGNGEA